MARAPTERQYTTLLALGDGAMVVSGGDRTLRAMVRRGWLEPDLPKYPDNGFRITPDGLRALAVAVERYGLPEVKCQPRPSERDRFRSALQRIRSGICECSDIAHDALYPEPASSDPKESE